LQARDIAVHAPCGTWRDDRQLAALDRIERVLGVVTAIGTPQTSSSVLRNADPETVLGPPQRFRSGERGETLLAL